MSSTLAATIVVGEVWVINAPGVLVEKLYRLAVWALNWVAVNAIRLNTNSLHAKV